MGVNKTQNKTYGLSGYLQTSELGVSECMEGDDSKFAVWTGRSPVSDYRIVIKVTFIFYPSSVLNLKEIHGFRCKEILGEC